MAKLKVTTSTDYSGQVFSPMIDTISFAGTSAIVTEATFSDLQFDNVNISQPVALIGTSSGICTVLVNVSGPSFDASGWTFTNWGADDGVHLVAGRGRNILTGTSKNDLLNGGAGNNTLNGGGGADILYGYNWRDNLIDGSDIMNGGDGNDLLVTQGHRDQIDGGDGIDTLLVQVGYYPGNFSVDISSGSASFGRYTSAANIEKLDFRGGGGNDTVTGGALNDELRGSTGSDTLNGGGGNDYLDGGAGSDIINGGAGHDFIVVSEHESDKIDGGSGIDTVSFNYFDTTLTGTHGLRVDIRGGGRGADIGNGTTLTSIERLSFFGLDGDDRVIGGRLDDDLNGGLGTDTLHGGKGKDYLNGNEGNDFLAGGAGADELWGGEGIDVASYSTSREGVNVDLLWGTHSGGEAEGDSIAGVEIIIGSRFNDSLSGDFTANGLFGGPGDDQLNGKDGNDVINGGAGRDMLTGGLGFDHFYYDNVSDSMTSRSRDVIVDFVSSEDKIDLSDIDANRSGGTDNDSFTYVGEGPLVSAGDLQIVHTLHRTIVKGDVDGDGSADFAIALDGLYGLLESDFIL